MQFKAYGSPRPGQQHSETVGSVFFHIFVRILCAAHFKHSRVDSRVGKQVYRLHCGLLPRHVTVVAYYHLFTVLAHQPRLFGGYGGAQCGYGVVEARLVKAYYVHISLAKDKELFLCVFGEIKAEKPASLVKHGCLVTVQILCQRVGFKSTTPEGDNISPSVDYREHDSMSEFIVGGSLLASGYERGGKQLVLSVALGHHMPF